MNLSWIALFLSVVATLPQLLQTLETGLLRDHNPSALLLSLLGNAILGIHGYIQKDIGLMLIGLWFACYNAVLAYYKIRSNQQQKD
jgi:uncharacterized protein with PQ loop repeat